MKKFRKRQSPLTHSPPPKGGLSCCDDGTSGNKEERHSHETDLGAQVIAIRLMQYVFNTGENTYSARGCGLRWDSLRDAMEGIIFWERGGTRRDGARRDGLRSLRRGRGSSRSTNEKFMGMIAWAWHFEHMLSRIAHGIYWPEPRQDVHKTSHPTWPSRESTGIT